MGCINLCPAISSSWTLSNINIGYGQSWSNSALNTLYITTNNLAIPSYAISPEITVTAGNTYCINVYLNTMGFSEGYLGTISAAWGVRANLDPPYYTGNLLTLSFGRSYASQIFSTVTIPDDTTTVYMVAFNCPVSVQNTGPSYGNLIWADPFLGTCPGDPRCPS